MEKYSWQAAIFCDHPHRRTSGQPRPPRQAQLSTL